MSQFDLVVIGGGISGSSLAHHAARAGKRVLVLERAAHAGGCLHSERLPGGYWYELGAHTCYNSYGELLDLLGAIGLDEGLQPRAKSVLRFIEGDRVLPGQNLGLLVRQLSKLELLRALPRWFGASPVGRTVREHYSSLLGSGNYERVLGPLISAVPSQRADDFPAEMLFKKRGRRKSFPRSFTLPGGLQGVVDGLLATPGVELRCGMGVRRIALEGPEVGIELDDGTQLEAHALGLAVSPSEAARLLAPDAPELAAELAGIREVRVQSLGFAVPLEAVALPYATFFIPREDDFHSVVTRDPVPDPNWRAFTFHFRPGLERGARLERAARLLGIRVADMQQVSERNSVLPSPSLGHAERIARTDAHLAQFPLALTGNWFAGLSIEDCVQRSRSEWERLERGPGSTA